DRDSHLLDGELCGSRRVAAREHAAARRDLYEIYPVLQVCPHDMADLIGSVRHREIALGREERDAHRRGIVVQVAMPAGDADAGACRTASPTARMRSPAICKGTSRLSASPVPSESAPART